MAHLEVINLAVVKIMTFVLVNLLRKCLKILLLVLDLVFPRVSVSARLNCCLHIHL